MAKLREIKVRFTEQDIAAIDKIAQSQGLSRSEYIRDHITGKRISLAKPSDFYRLVADAHHELGGAVNHSQVERIVAFTIARILGNEQRTAAESISRASA